MKNLFAVSSLVICLFVCKRLYADGGRVHVLPQPVSVTEQPGSFVLSGGSRVIVHSNEPSLKTAAGIFTGHLQTLAGFSVQVSLNQSSKTENGAINIFINQQADGAIGSEGYKLSVTKNSIALRANSGAGIFEGLQTLLQLLPVEAAKGSAEIPCAEITDYPRFGWRGLMLDVSRHYFTKDEVEKYIDEMSAFKYNTLHLHLSDDNGWRLEIKSLPNLTQIGAWRVKRTGRFGNFPQPQWREPATDGGFYTQDDMKEMLAYAAARSITILPEFDVPAHSLAMIASYPNLSCTQMLYFVNPGSRFYGEQDNVLCVGNDSVFAVLDKVFTEVAQIFPNQYIHIGGDEANKDFWEKCPRCQKRMADEHLQNTDELQSYFVKRIEQQLKAKGKKLIGWDEILEGGLAPEATVMSWRGMEGGVKAAKMGHHVVMSPWGFCYIDLYQGDPAVEPATYGKLLLKTAYSFEPVPDSIDASFILGGQDNLWSESVPTFRHAEYMTWPRALATAEVLWSPKAAHDWDGFVNRMAVQFKRFDAQHINYSTAAYDAVVTTKRGGADTLFMKIDCDISGTDIYYTFDETNADNYSKKYDGKPLTFPYGADNLKVITYKDGLPLGKQISLTRKQLEDRVNDRPDW